MDSPIATITGTATFNSVEIKPQSDATTNVTGYYHGDTTTYNVPPGCLFIGGLPVEFDGENSVAINPEADDEWVWVTATEDHLLISDEEPEDNDNSN